MILKYWFFILWLGFAAYGALRVLFGEHLLYSTQHWQYYYYMGAPVVLFLLAVKGWRISRMWRRMMEDRCPRPTLSRGEHEIQETRKRPSILEHVCAALFLLACAAILELFSVQHSAWWIGSLFCAALFVRMLLMAVRRP